MKKINLLTGLLGLATIATPFALTNCSKHAFTKEDFIKQYEKFLNNYLTSEQAYTCEPAKECADMEWHDQIIDHLVFTTFAEYPNRHFLRIFTTKQNTFRFCVGGNTVEEITNMISGALADANKQLEDTEHYTGHHLVEKYDVTNDYISYDITSTNGKDETFYLISIKINKNGYIEKFENTTDTEYLQEHSTEYGCLEVKYTAK